MEEIGFYYCLGDIVNIIEELEHKGEAIDYIVIGRVYCDSFSSHEIPDTGVSTFVSKTQYTLRNPRMNAIIVIEENDIQLRRDNA